MDLGDASIEFVKERVEECFLEVLGSLYEPSGSGTHVLDNIYWHEISETEVQPFLDIVPMNDDTPNNLVILLPTFNHEEYE